MKTRKGTVLAEYKAKANIEGICEKCGEKRFLTVDHIIPVSILDMLDYTGLLKQNWRENFELTCNQCEMALKINEIVDRLNDL